MSAAQLRLNPDAWRRDSTALSRIGRKLWTAAAALMLMLGALAVTLSVTTDNADAHPATQFCWVVGYETVQWGSQPYQSYQRPVHWCYYVHEDHPGPDVLWDIGTIIF